MKIIEVEQGSPEWHAHRSKHRNASEASVMMGASKNMARNDLVRIFATGSEKEYSKFVEEVVFARGHAVEALARPLAEKFIGDELYAVVGVHDDGYLAASLDGLTMDGSTAWECKQWNEAKAECVRAGKVPPEDYWQCVQVLHVSGAERLLYTVSDGTPEKTVHVWMSPLKRDVRDLLAGWKQLEADIDAYVPEAPAPAVIAEATEALPAVAVKMDGSIAVISNLDLFGDKLKAFIASLDKKPDSDQGFANAEAAVKTLKKAEEALEAAEASALAQMAPVEAMRRMVADYRELSRTTRLLMEKVVKNRKEEIRVEIQHKASAAWTAHVNTINARLGRVRITVATPDFAGAMKGKKTIDGLRGAVDDLLAKAKIEASQQAEDMAHNLGIVDEIAGKHPFLVRDLQDLVTINPEHLAGVLRGRIAEHEAAEQRRLEDERARIRAEEMARANREAQAKAEKELQRIRAEEQVKARAEADARALAQEQHNATIAMVERKADAKPFALDGVRIVEHVHVAPQPARSTLADIGKPRAAKRPSDAEIIAAIAARYAVDRGTVIDWLLAMDFDAITDSIAKECAA